LQTQCTEFESLIPVLNAFEQQEIQNLTVDITESDCDIQQLKTKTTFWVNQTMGVQW